MAKVPNGVETVPKNFNHLSRVHKRYRQTDGRTIAYSERKREFTFAQKYIVFNCHFVNCFWKKGGCCTGTFVIVSRALGVVTILYMLVV